MFRLLCVNKDVNHNVWIFDGECVLCVNVIFSVSSGQGLERVPMRNGPCLYKFRAASLIGTDPISTRYGLYTERLWPLSGTYPALKRRHP